MGISLIYSFIHPIYPNQSHFIGSLYHNVGNQLIDVETELTGKAAKNHANSDKSVIGGATSSVYGHVKLSDNYSSSAGAASASVAASSAAVYNCYVNLNKEVSAMGGLTLGDCLDNNISTLPFGVCRSAPAVVYNDEIHIFGGGSTYSNNHYKWNGSSWSGVSTLPYSFSSGCAVVYNNVMYILGGVSNSTTVNYFYRWNGSTWVSNGSLPIYFGNGCAVVYNNEIYILGSTAYKWNGSSWSGVSSVPHDCTYGSAVVYNNEIHVLGGSGNATAHYKWNGSSWSSVSTLPYKFHNGSAVVYNNEIHILGGDNDSIHTSHYKWNGSSWSRVGTLLHDLYKGSAVVYNNEIHILSQWNHFRTDNIYKIYLKSGTILTFPSDLVISISPTTYTSVSTNEKKITSTNTYTIKTYRPLNIF